MRTVTRFRGYAGAAVTLLAGCLLVAAAPTAAATPGAATVGPANHGAVAAGGYPLADRLAAEVSGHDVRRHLVALQAVADASGGNRGYDEIGFTRSALYVKAVLAAAGYHVVTQHVPYTDFVIGTERLTVSGADIDSAPVLMTRFTPSTAPEGIDAPLASLPAGRTGCAAADYDGVNVAGAVMVLARASCGYTTAQQVAAAAGARAVLIYYPTPSPANIYRFYAFEPDLFTIPIASVSQRDGELLAAAAAGGDVRVHLTLRGSGEPRTTVNLIAETSGGDPDNVVMIGGHLDSVPEGPGINDNGSTAATVLQVALALAKHQASVSNKVRFAWWGAEEVIDVGSGYYVDQLGDADRARIAALLNAELVASPNYARFVWDSGSGGGHAIADIFAGYFDRRNLPYERQSPDAVGSDHEVFEAIGIPVGGLDGGNLGVKTAAQQQRYGGQAGQMFDPCYHQTCDRLGNLDERFLDENARALAWVLGRLASYDDDVRTADAIARGAR